MGPPKVEPKLITQPEWLYRARLVGEEVRGVQRPVPEELVGRAMQFVGARLDHRVDDRAGTPSELGGISVGLNLELLEGVHGRLQDLGVVPPVGGRVGVVVHAIQHERVLEGAVAVHIEHALYWMSSRYTEFIAGPPMPRKTDSTF